MSAPSFDANRLAESPPLIGGSDYKTPPQTSPDQNERGAPNQVREKLFGGAGPIPILRAINNPKP